MLTNFCIFRLTEEVVNGEEKNLNGEKPLVEENAAVDGEKDVAKDENEEKEAEDKVKEYIPFEYFCSTYLFSLT